MAWANVLMNSADSSGTSLWSSTSSESFVGATELMEYLWPVAHYLSRIKLEWHKAAGT